MYYRVLIDTQMESIDELYGALMSIAGCVRRGDESGTNPSWRLVCDVHSLDELSALRDRITETIESLAVVSCYPSDRLMGKLEDIERNYPDDIDNQHRLMSELLSEVDADRKDYGIREPGQ